MRNRGSTPEEGSGEIAVPTNFGQDHFRGLAPSSPAAQLIKATYNVGPTRQPTVKYRQLWPTEGRPHTLKLLHRKRHLIHPVSRKSCSNRGIDRCRV